MTSYLFVDLFKRPVWLPILELLDSSQQQKNHKHNKNHNNYLSHESQLQVTLGQSLLFSPIHLTGWLLWGE